MEVAFLSFLTYRVDTECRASTEVEIMSSTDFSLREHESGGMSKIRSRPWIDCPKSQVAAKSANLLLFGELKSVPVIFTCFNKIIHVDKKLSEFGIAYLI